MREQTGSARFHTVMGGTHVGFVGEEQLRAQGADISAGPPIVEEDETLADCSYPTRDLSAARRRRSRSTSA